MSEREADDVVVLQAFIGQATSDGVDLFLRPTARAPLGVHPRDVLTVDHADDAVSPSTVTLAATAQYSATLNGTAEQLRQVQRRRDRDDETTGVVVRQGEAPTATVRHAGAGQKGSGCGCCCCCCSVQTLGGMGAHRQLAPKHSSVATGGGSPIDPGSGADPGLQIARQAFEFLTHLPAPF